MGTFLTSVFTPAKIFVKKKHAVDFPHVCDGVE
jgi:hypothetical protein